MRILFMGRKPAGATALRWTLEQGFDVVGVLTDSHLERSPTAQVAEINGLPLFTYESAVEALAEGDLSFDLGVSFVYWRILKEPLLSHPDLGIVNFHPAPLPEYKGTAGYNLAILESLDNWAVSAHYVDSGIDTGGIIDRIDFPIDPQNESVQKLEAKSMEQLLDLYKQTILRLNLEGTLPTTPNKGGRYVSRAEMEAMKRIERGDDVDRKIRAFWFPPYTGAYVEIDGHKYTLVNEQILNELAPEGTTTLHSASSKRSQ